MMTVSSSRLMAMRRLPLWSGGRRKTKLRHGIYYAIALMMLVSCRWLWRQKATDATTGLSVELYGQDKLQGMGAGA